MRRDTGAGEVRGPGQAQGQRGMQSQSGMWGGAGRGGDNLLWRQIAKILSSFGRDWSMGAGQDTKGRQGGQGWAHRISTGK